MCTENATAFIESLGKEVERLWQIADHSLDLFGQIAEDVLQKYPPHLNITFADAIALCGLGELPPQIDLDAKFGQPPVTLYLGQGFRIEFLFWGEGTPGIHQHAFSGAFHVLHGSSLQALWTFAPAEVIDSGLIGGVLTLNKTELLLTGATRRISAGSDFIHSTYHLERPSVTVVVRTVSETLYLPQYSYWYPTLAYDGSTRSESTIRSIQVASLLARCELSDELIALIRMLIRNGRSNQLAFQLCEVLPLLRDERAQDEVMELAKAADHRLMIYLSSAISEQHRRSKIIRLRQKIREKDLQFFLALLLNIPHSVHMASPVKEYTNNCDYKLVISQWIASLGRYIALDLDSVLIAGLLIYGSRDDEIMDNFAQREGTLTLERGAELTNRLIEVRSHWLLQPLFSPILIASDEMRTKR
jgi:hypothetical protein